MHKGANFRLRMFVHDRLRSDANYCVYISTFVLQKFSSSLVQAIFRIFQS